MRLTAALAIAVLSSLFVAGCGSGPGHPDTGGAVPSRRLLVLSLDGLPWDLAQAKMKDGKMPNLAALVARGAFASDGSLSCWPAKTAPGHATLWTGCWADRHRILGNDTPALPAARHSILDYRRGFDAAALGAEPVWRVAAREGRSVTVVQATHAEPDNAEEQALESLAIFNGYRDLVRAALVTGSVFAVGGENFAVDRDGDGVLVSCPRFRAHLAPGTWTAVDRPELPGVFYLYLAQVDAQGWTILRSSYSTVVGPSESEAARFRREVGGYAYNTQQLDPTLNDGTPWKRDLYLAATQLNADQVKKAVLWAMTAHPAELTIAYLPQPDAVLHEMLGKAEIWGDRAAAALIDDVLAISDRLVGDLVAALGPDGAIAVVSDHGMAPVDRVFFPNLALERAGLLARNEKGEINLGATQVMFSADGEFLVVNTLDHLLGSVKPEDKEGFLSLAERELAKSAEAALGPGTLLPPLRPAETSGDVRVSPDGDSWIAASFDGVRLNALLSPKLPPKDAPLSRPIDPMGYHTGDPRIPRLKATMVFAGPGFAKGPATGVRHVDFAPTVLEWMGLGAPFGVAGKTVREFLETK